MVTAMTEEGGALGPVILLHGTEKLASSPGRSSCQGVRKRDRRRAAGSRKQLGQRSEIVIHEARSPRAYVDPRPQPGRAGLERGRLDPAPGFARRHSWHLQLMDS